MQHLPRGDGPPQPEPDIMNAVDQNRYDFKMIKGNRIEIVDLFAGIGATRIGFEQACKVRGWKCSTVFTSEIKESARKVLADNFPGECIAGDITRIGSDEIPDFDVLLAGFPCQPFSDSGTRNGFLDTRGTLFFEIERILHDKRPVGFILENVEGLRKHDRESLRDRTGRTLKTILSKLERLGYRTDWTVLDARDFGLAQQRRRIFIVGTRTGYVDLDKFEKRVGGQLKDILESGLPGLNTGFSRLLLSRCRPEELFGRSIKDRRGSDSNIHSWDLELKGEVTEEQKELLNLLLKERRRKHWSKNKGIVWMDGMPLTAEEIGEFYPRKNLKEMLDDLVQKGYVRYEHPKQLIVVTHPNGLTSKHREYKKDAEKGYNIVAGKLSFPINKILDPNSVAPTLVATDLSRLAVIDGASVRNLSIKECLRLFGFSDEYQINVDREQAYDLFGNTIAIPVIRAVAERLLDVIAGKKHNQGQQSVDSSSSPRHALYA